MSSNGVECEHACVVCKAYFSSTYKGDHPICPECHDEGFNVKKCKSCGDLDHTSFKGRFYYCDLCKSKVKVVGNGNSQTVKTTGLDNLFFSVTFNRFSDMEYDDAIDTVDNYIESSKNVFVNLYDDNIEKIIRDVFKQFYKKPLL